ncbi:ABC transporter ATP-binding protein [Microlunatus soli]|uniref:Iron complex transport system ATP-binding protein n=1 Tax=Microlunatus soli TaxID=630515 RepID=A0A1H1UTK1_9ACTN|nr:ATP-binding cassette domain-containing protein [Microlunatus soli]SDS75807.1 iron complex transport system ATP-binding protein [Microlunatus soli]
MPAEPTERTDTVLDLDRVTFRRADKEILHGISFTARAGEHWALLGPNGAGKSTILGFCGAVTHPTTGTVDVLGHRLGRVELQALRRQIGHVNPRHPLRSPLTIRDVVLTGFTGSIERPLRWEPSIEQLETVDKLLFTLGLGTMADEVWPTLSQGERGRTLIARSLINSPRLLLLDEPSTGLDVAAREQLLETIDTLDVLTPTMAWVLVTHHLEELPMTTTHAILVSAGAVVASGPVDEVITTAHVSAAFDHDITVTRDDGRWSARARRTAFADTLVAEEDR